MKRRRVVIIVIVLLMLCGCVPKIYPPCLTQPLENVKSIELLDTKDYQETVLYTLTDEEYAPFWSKLLQIPFGRCFNDPPTWHGILAVRIIYSDGCIDILGTDINSSYDAAGKPMRTGWFYLQDEDDFVALFSQYIEGLVTVTEKRD